MLACALLLMSAGSRSAIVGNDDAFADLEACARSFDRRAPVVVTSADTAFLRVLPAWSGRVGAFGYTQRIVIALGGGRSLFRGAGACVVRYGPEGSGPAAGAGPRAAEALPPQTGLSKFEVVAQLLRWRFEAICYSELDVFWARDAIVAARAAAGARRRVLAAQDNVHDDELNIGFFYVRPGRRICRFFLRLSAAWRRELAAAPADAGATVARDQAFFWALLRDDAALEGKYVRLDRTVFAKGNRRVARRRPGEVADYVDDAATAVVHLTGLPRRDKLRALARLYRLPDA